MRNFGLKIKQTDFFTKNRKLVEPITKKTPN